MDIFYHFDCTFPAVFTVNGVFFESLNRLKSGAADSLYVTVLPLDALYLPYTVKLGSGGVFANSALCTVYQLKKDRYYVKLLPRFNYVYSPIRHNRTDSESKVKKLFDSVKQGDTVSARTLLSEELSASVDDKSLIEFFDGYKDVVENNGYINAPGESFFLIPDGAGAATLFKVEYKNSLIDNIAEV